MFTRHIRDFDALHAQDLKVNQGARRSGNKGNARTVCHFWSPKMANSACILFIYELSTFVSK